MARPARSSSASVPCRATARSPISRMLSWSSSHAASAGASSALALRWRMKAMVASKAARCVLAAAGHEVIDFGLRRAHGAEAALFGARACFLAGCTATATVLAVTLVPGLAVGPAASSANAATSVTTAKTVTATPIAKVTVVKKKSPKALARDLARNKHKWKSTKQWNCLNRLWHKESKWKVKAGNPNGGPYGIPQAYPGHKMGKGWKTSAATQIKWGLKYIDGRYGTPCGADRHSRTKGWY